MERFVSLGHEARCGVVVAMADPAGLPLDELFASMVHHAPDRRG